MGDEEEWDDAPPEALSGSATGLDGNDMGDLLLSLIADCSRLLVLLAEAEPAEYRVVARRLKAFQELAAAMPKEAQRKQTSGQEAKVIGFRVPERKIRKKRR